MEACADNPTTQKPGTGGSLALDGWPPSPSVSPGPNKTYSLPKIKVTMTEEYHSRLTSALYMHDHAHVHASAQTHAPTHT